MTAPDIYDRLGELIACCDTVRDADKCNKCPLKEMCLEEESFERVANKVKIAQIRGLISLADAITEDEEENSKTEYDRKWEAEAEKWNLRRCDPDE